MTKKLLLSPLLVSGCSLLFGNLATRECQQASPRCEGDVLIQCTQAGEVRESCEANTCDEDGGVCAQCGDGIESLAEACDDGNLVDGDGCTADCSRAEACGDGFPDEGELCDDGNLEAGDGCSGNCLSDESCANGIIDAVNNEECDDGNSIDGDGCTIQCQLDCGNGFLDLAANEECDDGNDSPNDGCVDCQVEAGHLFDFFFEPNDTLPRSISGVFGGDGFSATAATPIGEEIFMIHGDVGVEGDEDVFRLINSRPFPSVLSLQALGTPIDGGFRCDNEPVGVIVRDVDGVALADSGNLCEPFSLTIAPNQEVFLHVVAPLDTLFSFYTIFFNFCGNGFSFFEECDDGNDQSGDGCSPSCQSELCGDGVVLPLFGEECDPGFGNFGNGCDPNCALSGCGNGFLARDTGETCDDGNLINGDGCDASCLREDQPLCRNGVLDAGEACDDGNISIADGCNNDCTLSRCGDGIFRADLGEQCDDGNNFQFDSCDAGCVAASCGNGRVDVFLDEACDDGNLIDGDGCDSTCQPSCGNGVVDPVEQCEDGNLINFDDCVNCQNARCGDGVIHVGEEQCDDGDLFGGCVQSDCFPP